MNKNKSAQNNSFSSLNKGISSILILVVVFVLIVSIGGFVYFKNRPSSVTSSKQVNLQNSDSTTVSLKSVMASLNSLYGGTLDWSIVNKKQSYKFFTKDINGLTVANDEVSTNYDSNYSPITSITLGGSSVPVKNAYSAYYQVPEVLIKKFNLAENDIAFPIELKIYEFDRKLSDNEKKVITDGTFFKCNNDKSTVKKDTYSDSNTVMFYCDTNLTVDQKKQVANKGFFDEMVDMYIEDSNILVEVGFDSAYIKDYSPYLQDFLSKQFNTNDTLFVSSTQVKTVEDARKFEELRHRTFDK